MKFIKKIISYLYYSTIELCRILFNKFFYFTVNLYIKLFNIELLRVFNDSNGWFLTYKYKKYIYKVIGPFLFLRRNHSYILLKKNLIILKNIIEEKDILFIPSFEVYTFYLKFKFIKNTNLLNTAIKNLDSSGEKIDIFIKLLNTLNDFHNLGFSHGDLKPKNILVDKDLNIFFIDLEDIKVITEENKRIDYIKLIPRIIYFLNKKEVIDVVNSIESIECKKYIEEFYLKEYNIKHYLEKFSFIEFEKEIYSDEEDIDITVSSFNDFIKIKQDLKILKLDIQIFYCCTIDFKIFIYNQNKFSTIDVHLTKPISKYYLLYLKFVSNKYKNIFITGPDGIGKTTVINNILNGKDKFIYTMFNVNLQHANRFIQNKSIIYNSKAERFLTCKYFGCLIKKNIVMIKNKWYAKSIINIYDRSFFDQFIYKNNSLIDNILLKIFGHIKDIILLVDTSKNILSRKKELNDDEIKLYYKNFSKFRDNITRIDVKNINQIEYKLNSVLQHKLLTKVN